MGRDILRLVTALIDVAAGLVAVVYPGITAEVLAIVVGIWAIFGGSVELAGERTGRSGWLAVGGLLTIAVGVVLIVWPSIGAVSLALVFGIYLLAYGITLLVSGATGTRRSSRGARLRHCSAVHRSEVSFRPSSAPPAAQGSTAAPARLDRRVRA